MFVFTSGYLGVRYGWTYLSNWLVRQEKRYERVLVHQLLMDIKPRTVLALIGLAMFLVGLAIYLITDGLIWGIVAAFATLALPGTVVRYLEQKRRERLELQLVDGVTTLASGVRAGLNLVQAMELLVTNSAGPIKQEFSQLLREYQMGLDLNQCMRNASNRIGLQNYRLLFTAIELHRTRGGNSAESLDRIADSIREIQRLEGKLDAITAQGRSQARMMAASPLLIIVIFWSIDPQGVQSLFVEPIGRVVLLAAAALIVCGFLWIKQIMQVDI